MGSGFLAQKTWAIVRPKLQKGTTMKSKLSKIFWTLMYATAAYTVAQSVTKRVTKAVAS